MKGKIKVEFELSKDYIASFATVMCNELPDMAGFKEWLKQMGGIVLSEDNDILDVTDGAEKPLIASIVIASFIAQCEEEEDEEEDDEDEE